MSNDQFNELLKRMPKIAEAINSFKSEQVQLLAFKMFLNDPDSVKTEFVNDKNNPREQQKNTAIKKETAKKQNPRGGSKKTKKTKLHIDKNLNLKPTGKQAIDAFVTQKSPSTLLEKVTICVYYLQCEIKIKDVGYDQVLTCFKHLKWRLPSDLPNTMQQAGTKGWLDTSNRTDIKMATHGENLVVHDLPKKISK